MKKIFAAIVILAAGLFLSCAEKTDYDERLNGVWVNETEFSRRVLRFNYYAFKIDSWFFGELYESDGGDKEYKFNYKIKIVRKNKKGGTFHAIFDYDHYDPATAFDDPSIRKRSFNYTFDGDKLLLEENPHYRIYTTIYIRQSK